MYAILRLARVTFKYDPMGRRIDKTSSGTTSIYAYDGQNLTEETNASGTVIARYEQGTGVDDPLAMLRSSSTSYYQQDGHGSVTSLTSSAGSLAATYTYDSLGNLTASTGSLVSPYQYTGRELDSETGLYYYRARYYDQSSGRFLSEDPIRFNAGPNFYAYVGNNQTNFSDPTGNNSLVDTVLNYFAPPPPPPSLPSNIARPVSPPILYTDMNGGQPGGSTTFYPGNNDPVITISTFTRPDSKSKPGAGNPYCSTVIGVLPTAGGNPAYGPVGAYINTGDSRGRVVHGGGSSLEDPFDPNQPLTPTRGCTRGHNQDVVDLGQVITQYQQNNPGMPITYCRK
jgi:RHS repeat-associated protein